MNRQNVTNTEALLIGDDFSKFFFSAVNDSVCTRTINLRSVSKSSSGSVIHPLLVRIPLKFVKICKIYATMPISFAESCAFATRKLMVTCAVRVVISWFSFINSVPGANFLDLISVITSVHRNKWPVRTSQEAKTSSPAGFEQRNGRQSTSASVCEVITRPYMVAFVNCLQF